MKRIVSLLVMIFLMMSFLLGCGGTSRPALEDENGERLYITATATITDREKNTNINTSMFMLLKLPLTETNYTVTVEFDNGSFKEVEVDFDTYESFSVGDTFEMVSANGTTDIYFLSTADETFKVRAITPDRYEWRTITESDREAFWENEN